MATKMSGSLRRTYRPSIRLRRNHGIAVLLGATLAAATVAIAPVLGFAADERERKAAQTAWYEEANRRQVANAPNGPKSKADSMPLPEAPIAWDQGVFESQDAAIPKGIIRITSVWGQTVGDRHFAVLAGASVPDPAQGLVIVQSYSLTGRHLSDEDYPTPSKAGALRIVSANGHLLTLSGGSGEAFAFDFDSRQFR